MSRRLPPDQYDNWVTGVVTSMKSDALPPTASPRGRNSALLSVGPGAAKVGKRRGGSPLVSAAEAMGSVTPAPSTQATIHSLHAYRRLVSGAYTPTLLAAQHETGDLYAVADDGTTTLLDAAAFGVNQTAPGWATFDSTAFGFAGTERVKVVDNAGTLVVQNIGIVRPPATGATAFNWTAAVSAVAGVMDGTYELALSFYNELTGVESSRSDETAVSPTLDQVNLAWATSPDSQITHVRVHIRKTAPSVLNEDFLWVQAGTGFVAGKGVPIATAATTLNLTNAEILAFTLSPDTVEYTPPAKDVDGASLDSLYGAVVHGSRLLCWSRTGVYYSQFDKPEQFDPESFEPVGPGVGGELVACHAVNEDVVAVFKRGALYGIFGNDPNSWSVDLIDPSVGCVAPASIVTVEGKTYWWSALGPVVWDHASAPVQLGFRLLRTTADPDYTNPAAWEGIVAHVDPPRQQVVFWVPEAGSVVNNIGLPFNYQLQAWESDRWDPFDVAAAVSGEDSDGRPYVLLGGYYGRVYRWWDADVDGARTANPDLATVTLSGTVFDVTTTTLTAAGTVVFTAALEDHLITVYDADGESLTRRITAVSPSGLADTATVTLDSALDVGFVATEWVVDSTFTLQGTIAAASTVGSYTRVEVTGALFDSDLTAHTYAYVHFTDGSNVRRRIVAVGLSGDNATMDLYPLLPMAVAEVVGATLTVAAPVFELDTKDSHQGDRFVKKRYSFLHVSGACDEGATTAYIDVFLNYAQVAPARQFTLDVATGGAIWDTAQFDVDAFGGDEPAFLRRNVGAIARAYRHRIRHIEPGRQFVLLALEQEASALGGRR